MTPLGKVLAGIVAEWDAWRARQPPSNVPSAPPSEPVPWSIYHRPSHAMVTETAKTAFEACQKRGWLLSECEARRV